MKKTEMIRLIEATPARSAWARGVKAYAVDLVGDLASDEMPADLAALEKEMLNGADSWGQYSEGGCALVYNADIAERLCSPSELKRTRGGERDPNARETWIDCQTRALGQAWCMIRRVMKGGK
jgi:hypothetical protein